MTQEEREYQEYLRWRASIMAKIAELYSEIAEYKTFEYSVSGLKDILGSYVSHLNNIYTYTKDGISSRELDASIDKISMYSNEAESASNELNSILGEIKAKIEDLQEEVAGFRALLG